MSGFRFSVPYNNDFSLLERLVEIKEMNGNNIEEVYFSGPQEYFGSGRVVEKVTIEDIIKVIKFCKENRIKTNLLLNSTCEGIDWYSPLNVSKVLKLIEILHLENGLDGVTIANPLFIQKIRKEFPKLEITASVLSQIDSVQRAMFFKNFGCNVITPDRDINRNLKLLKEIKEVGFELKLMVNEGCLFKCPYRIFHFNLISHWSKEGIIPKDYFFFNCQEITKMDPSQILKSQWINPENLEKYKETTNYFKITGRTRTTEWILNTVTVYMKEELEGNLLDIMDSNLDYVKNKFGAYINNKELEKIKFFEKVLDCNKNCFKCKFCEELAKKVVKFNYSKNI